VKPLPAFAVHSWLAAVVPAAATRFRVSDPDLAYTLSDAGARVVDHDPEVEIAPLHALGADAPVAIVPIGGRTAPGAGRALRAGDRIASSLAARRRAADARRALKRRGYTEVAVVPWDRDQVIRVPGAPARRGLSAAERFPRGMLLVASRRARGPTALDQALAQAARASGRTLHPAWPVLRASGPVVVAPSAVLRVALGPGRHRLDAQKLALTALSSAPHPLIAERTPAPLGDGVVGLARWTLEQRLPGSPAPHDLDRALLDECTGFAVALHGLPGGEPAAPPAEQAETVAQVLPTDKGQALRALAQRCERELAELPHGFAHGDFCSSNLLVADGRLAGVVDWEHARRGRPPLLDVLHLRLLSATRAGVYEWGDAVRGQLLGARGRAGAVALLDPARRLGLSLSAAQTDALAAAYWLDRVSDQIGAYVERSRDPVWIERNVERVLDTLVARL
jgi:hypothetical protein